MERTIVPATGPLLDEILALSHDIWGEGLSRDAYARFNRAQAASSWGAAHLERVALVTTDGTLLSTAKRYDLQARVDGRSVRVLGIGAVFTPPHQRRQRFAADLIERLLDRARGEGYEYALLFSAIGSEYYRRLGFRAVPIAQVSFVVRQKPGAPAVNVRSGEDRDLRFLAEMHEARATTCGARFFLERDADFIQFAISRKRMLAGLGPANFRQLEYFVVDEGGRAVAYAVVLNTDGVRMLTECGDRDPSGARLGALLQAVLARTPREKSAPVRAWLPRGFRPPQIDIVDEERPAVVMMIQALGSSAALLSPLEVGDVMYWLNDVM
ncbi:MAG: GNAT family N-acetyltransferase [Bacteroidales bacterium]